MTRVSDVERRDRAVAQVRRELLRLVRDSGESQRSIEQKNGFTRGYLSQVLQGHITLTMRHVLGILLALGTEPARFFGRLFPLPGQRGPEMELSEIRERLEVYDAAFKKLAARGLLDDPPPSGGDGR